MQTKKKRPSRRIAEISDVTDVKVETDEMQVDEKPIVPRQRNLDANFVDDEELQAALARSRRAKTAKKLKKLSPEELARKSLSRLSNHVSSNANLNFFQLLRKERNQPLPMAMSTRWRMTRKMTAMKRRQLSGR